MSRHIATETYIRLPIASRYGTLLICAALVVFCGESRFKSIIGEIIGMSQGLASLREKHARIDLMKLFYEREIV